MRSEPLFISGLYRSGTTLLAQILNQSKKMNITFASLHYMRNFYNKFNIDNNLQEVLQEVDDHLVNKGHSLELDVVYENLKAKPKVTHAELYDEVIKNILHLKSDDRWGEKSNVAWESILPFLELFPNGKVVHIYRDPRAVLASFKFFTYLPKPMYMDAIFASLAMYHYIMQDSVRLNPRVMLLSYEELVSQPLETIKKLCEFVNIPFEHEMLNSSSFKDSKGNIAKPNTSYQTEDKGIFQSSCNAWESKLTNIEIYLTELVNKEMLYQLGYKNSNIDLNSTEYAQLYELLHSEYIEARYQYWLKTGSGLQVFPDTKDAYEVKKN